MKKFFRFLLSAALVLLCCAAIAATGLYFNGTAPNNVTEAPEELTQVGSPYKFYYSELENIEKQAYNDILSEIYSMPESIRIPKIDSDQLNRVFSALLYDNPDLFFIGRRCTLSTKIFSTFCSLDYIVSREEYPAYKEALEKACDDVLASLTDIEDEWQTELEIHDRIVDNCEYNLVEDELIYSSAYGALVNGSAACEGYSKAAKLLFDKVGIESGVLSGISKNFDGTTGAHMWNAVKILGDFYYLDCTWDDPVSENGESVKIYSYFNINDDMIAASHSDFSHDFGCNASVANYYVKTGKYFETYDRSDEKLISELIARELSAGSNSLQLRFGSKNAYDEAVSELLDGGRMRNVLIMASEKTSVEFSLDSMSYYKGPEQLMLTFVLKID